jgi:hypothetical protein
VSGIEGRGPDGRLPDAQLEDFPSLRVFGERLATERSARRARWRARGTALPRGATFGSVGVLALIVTGTAAAGLTVLTGSPIPEPLRSDDTVTVWPTEADVRVAAVRSPDPEGGPSWGVRIGSADGGLVCAGPGQVQGERFGIVGVDGRFRVLPAQLAGGCVTAPTPGHPIVAARAVAGDRRTSYGQPLDGTTVLYGLGGDRLRSAVVRTPDGRVLRPRVGSDGVFVLALRGLPDQTQPVVDLTWRGGERRRVDLRRLATVPDPDGGSPWTVSGTDAVAVARPRTGSRRPTAAPPTGPPCFSIISAAAGGAPRLCGTVTGRAWTLRPRAAPGRTVDLRTTDRWAGPSRTLVMVRSAPGDTPVVTAARRSWPVRWAGSFGGRSRVDERDIGWVAVLPRTIDPSVVRVRAEDGGPAVPTGHAVIGRGGER